MFVSILKLNYKRGDYMEGQGRYVCRFALENYEISEEDFYPPKDDRALKSNIDDMYCDEFGCYCEEIFALLEELGVYDKE